MNKLFHKIKTGGNSGIVLFIAVFFIANMLFLTRYPLVHSDESWLSGLSRDFAMTGQYSGTESFFDLKPRLPHAIRILFHLIQVFFIRVGGYHLFGMRLISLIAASIVLWQFFRLCLNLLGDRHPSLIATILLGIDLQFTYSAHFARPELILLALLVIGTNYFCSHRQPGLRSNLILAAITGLGIGFHPNSLILAICFTLFYGYRILFTKELRIRDWGIYLTGVGLIALIFIGMSIMFHPNFVYDYFSYGERQFGVLNPASAKLVAFLEFYRNIFLEDTGTYFLPKIQSQLILFGCSLIIAIAYGLTGKARQDRLFLPLLGIIGVNLGLLVIGRFNQTSIIFQIPFFYLIITAILMTWPARIKNIGTVLLTVLLFSILLTGVFPYLSTNYYSNYLNQISRYVPKDRPVLASLNAEYYFAWGKLHDYRNLSYLKQNNRTLAGYIKENQIDYIIYPESIDWIYRKRPEWNYVYGSVFGYYQDLKRFLTEECTQIGSFSDPFYGTEIARAIGKRGWKVTIYQVNRN